MFHPKYLTYVNLGPTLQTTLGTRGNIQRWGKHSAYPIWPRTRDSYIFIKTIPTVQNSIILAVPCSEYATRPDGTRRAIQVTAESLAVDGDTESAENG